jgi:hypothetical protein
METQGYGKTNRLKRDCVRSKLNRALDHCLRMISRSRLAAKRQPIRDTLPHELGE